MEAREANVTSATFQQDFELEEDSEYYQRKLTKNKDMSGGKGGSKGGKRDLRA